MQSEPFAPSARHSSAVRPGVGRDRHKMELSLHGRKPAAFSLLHGLCSVRSCSVSFSPYFGATSDPQLWAALLFSGPNAQQSEISSNLGSQAQRGHIERELDAKKSQ